MYVKYAWQFELFTTYVFVAMPTYVRMYQRFIANVLIFLSDTILFFISCT